jgi:hypothetical protein
VAVVEFTMAAMAAMASWQRQCLKCGYQRLVVMGKSVTGRNRASRAERAEVHAGDA